MVLKQSKNPYGYRNLLVYKKAEEMQGACAEGWKRNSTREYYEFLGYSIAANAELEEDCNDIWKGFCPINPHLPSILQLKLRAKESDYERWYKEFLSSRGLNGSRTAASLN